MRLIIVESRNLREISNSRSAYSVGDVNKTGSETLQIKEEQNTNESCIKIKNQEIGKLIRLESNCKAFLQPNQLKVFIPF